MSLILKSGNNSLVKNFWFLFIGSIGAIALLNILFFWFFYNSYLRIYLSEKIKNRETVSIEYVNSLIEKQTLEDIDELFNDAEFEFFELLDLSNGNIPLNTKENVNIVVNFLMKSGVSPKYIEQVIPENNLEQILESLQNPSSPESHFLKRFLTSIILSNIVFLFAILIFIYYSTKKIISPLQNVTQEIKNLKLGSIGQKIIYPRHDEIGMLVDAINGINKRLSIQESIRNRLLADISHELKTPITSIQCYLEGITDGVITLNAKNFQAITEEMKRLINLVNKIMEYEKFENTELSLKKESLNLYEFIENLLPSLQAQIKENHQMIFIEGSKNIEIFADRELFAQLIHNVVGNFKKYAGNNTELKIIISSQKISFQDNGKGISRKEVPFIFEKFYQGKEEKTGNIEMRGIGVGLSVVKKIIESHHWRYSVHSDTQKGFTLDIDYTPSPNIHD